MKGKRETLFHTSQSNRNSKPFSMCRGIYFTIFIFWLLDIGCASKPTEVIGYEGENISFQIRYPAVYEKHDKYISRSKGFFFKKLVQTSQANRWIRHGRVAAFDNTAAHRFTVLISALVMEDSGLYVCGVDVKLQTDPVSEIQITIRTGEAQRPTTPPRGIRESKRMVISSLHSPANITAHNQAKESHLRLVAAVSLLCVCTLLCVCPFGVLKVFHRVAVDRLSVVMSYHARKISDQVVDEYVKMSPVVLPNSPTSCCDNCSSVNDSDRSTNAALNIDPNYIDAQTQGVDVDQIYVKMNADSFHESVYQIIDQISD